MWYPDFYALKNFPANYNILLFFRDYKNSHLRKKENIFQKKYLFNFVYRVYKKLTKNKMNPGEQNLNLSIQFREIFRQKARKQNLWLFVNFQKKIQCLLVEIR